ncbi:MAG TPA: glycosyltransferase family 2 protein [Candidatus Dormibacteraeota bacterium]|nr:glycosyltransferase family 2 protein [Candidatus Dormibacteraeota bacterium]
MTSPVAASRAGPAVSVLIPCWNAAATVGRALESVLGGSDVDLECIVVDDGSTDETVAIVRAIAERDPRVVLLPLDANVGVSAARNRGLELVRGDWLTLVDADDRLRPGGLAALQAAAIEHHALAVVGQQVWSTGRRTWLGRAYDVPDIRLPGRKSLARNPGLLYYVSPHGKLVHRSCFGGLEFHGRVLGDQPWTIRALLRAGDRIEVIADTVYEWNRPPRGGASTITTRTRSSADLGVEVVEMAGIALMDVRGEIDRVLADPADRVAVAARYVERLLRSDLGGLVLRALVRRDAGTAALLAAIERFIGAVPAQLLSASDALSADILLPPLRFWWRLPLDARIAYWSLFAAARRLAPDSVRNAPGWMGAVGLRSASPTMGAVRHAVLSAILTIGWGAELAGALARARLRRAPRR